MLKMLSAFKYLLAALATMIVFGLSNPIADAGGAGSVSPDLASYSS